MDGEIAAAGDAVLGGLAARAAEPRAGAAAHGRHGALCLNCGTRLIGAHYHACGQSGHVHRTMGAIGHELAHGVFHFEGKIWRTLPMLAFRPGELTRRYVAGERARFVSPLALFLFSVFLMFAVVANLPGLSTNGGLDGLDRVDIDRARAQVAGEALKTEAAITRIEKRLVKERGAAKRDEGAVADLERDLAAARKNLASFKEAQRFLPEPDAKPAHGSPKTPDRSAPADTAIDIDVPDAPKNWLMQKYRQAKDDPKLLYYKL